jgi:hypothetical protein
MNLVCNSPQATGSCSFAKSTPYFADNDLGTGAVTTLRTEVDGKPVWEATVELLWLDWNWFEFVGVSAESLLRGG